MFHELIQQHLGKQVTVLVPRSKFQPRQFKDEGQLLRYDLDVANEHPEKREYVVMAACGAVTTFDEGRIAEFRVAREGNSTIVLMPRIVLA